MSTFRATSMPLRSIRGSGSVNLTPSTAFTEYLAKLYLWLRALKIKPSEPLKKSAYRGNLVAREVEELEVVDEW